MGMAMHPAFGGTSGLTRVSVVVRLAACRATTGTFFGGSALATVGSHVVTNSSSVFPENDLLAGRSSKEPAYGDELDLDSGKKLLSACERCLVRSDQLGNV